MGLDTRASGAGPRLSLLDSDEARLRQEMRMRYSSIRTVIFRGPGATAREKIVTNECSPDTPYSVSGDVNFRPGTPVLVGSSQGGEETILALAPVDKAGAAASPVRRSTGTIRRPQPPAPPSVCPQPITGKQYVAIYREPGADTIHAWLYGDGTYLSELGSLDFSAEPWGITEGQEYWRVTGPERIVFKVRMPGWDGLVTWNPAASSFVLLDTELAVSNDVISDPIVSGGFVYFTHKNGQFLQIYKVAVGASGVLDTVTAALGAPLDCEAGGAFLAPGASLSHHGGERFSVASFEFNELAGLVAVPYFEGSWSTGLGRITLAGDDPGYGSNGRNVLGSYALRSTDAGGHKLGLMPHPGSPEVSMLHPEWALTLGPVCISPGGTQVTVYPASDGVTTGLLRLPVSLPPPSYPSSCPPPLIAVEDGPLGSPEVMLCRD